MPSENGVHSTDNGYIQENKKGKVPRSKRDTGKSYTVVPHTSKKLRISERSAKPDVVRHVIPLTLHELHDAYIESPIGSKQALKALMLYHESYFAMFRRLQRKL